MEMTRPEIHIVGNEANANRIFPHALICRGQGIRFDVQDCATLQRLRACSLSLLIAAPALFVDGIFSLPAHADSISKFYEGKTITAAIGTSSGGGYDLYTRMLAKFLGKHIPGTPAIVPTNMPGAGGLRVTNFLYSAAPKDGTFFGTFSRSNPIIPLFSSDAKFDGTKFDWLGSIASDTSLCITGEKSPIKTWNDMLTTQVVMGGQSVGADSDIYARLYRNVFGAKIKLVSGYPGTTDIILAMERGEVDGICGLSWSTIKISRPEWVKQERVHFLVQAGLKEEPDLSAVPLAIDLTDDPEKKQILELHLASQGMARPYAAPPGTVAERKAALIKAFDDTMKDPDFLAEAAKAKIEVNPMTGREIDALLQRLYATPPDIVAKAAKAIAE
jgi:tripartite-type tricarboxylate transporter receptor subunit TctC